MHPGTGRGEPADKRGLLADRAYRRFREIVDLPGEAARDGAGAD